MTTLIDRDDSSAETSVPQVGGATIFGLRRAALIELALFFAIALTIDFFALGGGRFAGIAPHPFWLAVLLVTAQYGTNEGLVAAAASSAALRLGNVPAQTIGQDFYGWLLDLSLQPILWFAAAVILGELVDRRRRTALRLDAELAAARQRERVIADAFDQMSRLKENLEARVAGQLKTVLTTYNAARSIEKFDTGEVLVGVSGLVKSILNPEKFSLFLLNKQHLEAAANVGWEAQDHYAREFDANSILFRSVVAGRKSLSAIDPIDERLLSGEGVLAGPLLAVDTGEIVGMLKVERLGFLDLNPTSVQNFQLLCDWIGTAFANARRFEDSQEQSGAFSIARNMLSSTLFERQRGLMLALARRVGFDLTVLYLRIEGEGVLNAESVTTFTRSVATAAQSLLRATDLVFERREDGWHYALLLPKMRAETAVPVVERLTKAVEELLDASHVPGRVRHLIEELHRAEG
jgi:polysaccharide biosynthesis protein PelD